MMHRIELYQRTMEADLDDPSGAKRVMLSVLARVPYNIGAPWTFFCLAETM